MSHLYDFCLKASQAIANLANMNFEQSAVSYVVVVVVALLVLYCAWSYVAHVAQKSADKYR
jgi:hypothetical protein